MPKIFLHVYSSLVDNQMKKQRIVKSKDRKTLHIKSPYALSICLIPLFHIPYYLILDIIDKVHGDLTQ